MITKFSFPIIFYSFLLPLVLTRPCLALLVGVIAPSMMQHKLTSYPGSFWRCEGVSVSTCWASLVGTNFKTLSKLILSRTSPLDEHPSLNVAFPSSSCCSPVFSSFSFHVIHLLSLSRGWFNNRPVELPSACHSHAGLDMVVMHGSYLTPSTHKLIWGPATLPTASSRHDVAPCEV